MTKRRIATPHTPPPTSKQGPSLRTTLAQRIGVQPEWNRRDNLGIVHRWIPAHGETTCGRFMKNDDDTLAPVTCLWCIADREIEDRWSFEQR